MTFPTADLLGNGSNRVVFDIGGNNYRMICSYYFSSSTVHLFVKWIGTHSDYDKLCKERKQYTIDQF
jgi:mRNA interferase HigB